MYRSFIVYRHFGGAAADHIQQLATATWTNIAFADDVALAETEPRTEAFTTMGLQLINDSDNPIFLSLDGSKVHFELFGKENIILDNFRVSQIFLKATNAADNYRLIVWPWDGEDV